MSQALVAQIKAELEARGVDLSGPCGAFQIVKRVAWALRHDGYGLLGGKNPAQNGCTVNGERYSVDWILKPNGIGRDILGDAGNANSPQWGHEEHADPSLYRPAIDPGDAIVPPVHTPPVLPTHPAPMPDTPPVSLTPLLERIAELEQRVQELFGFGDTTTTLGDRISALENKQLPDYLGTVNYPFFGSRTVRSKPESK